MRKKRKNIKNQNPIISLPLKKPSFFRKFYEEIVIAALMIVGLLLSF